MNNYLTFSSEKDFTIKTNNSTKNWDGVIEYSLDTITWNVWDGTTTLTSLNHKLYLRGIGNSKITGLNNNARWVIDDIPKSYVGSVECVGNIENLLDYETVEKNQHPTMASYCFRYLFNYCHNLLTAPELPSMQLSTSCYAGMFVKTSLKKPPALPAKILTPSCYSRMFESCEFLEEIPALPAKELVSYCYYYMFYHCIKLKLSTTQTDVYVKPYRIPSEGTGTGSSSEVYQMFAEIDYYDFSQGTPSINTTYYTSNNVVYPETNTPISNTITLYQNTSEPHRVDKSEFLTEVGEYSGIFRDSANIVNPIIRIQTNDIPNFNYVKIGILNRYYFVTDYDIVRTGLIDLYLTEDVLMTYREGVYKLKAFIERNQYANNPYLIDKKRIIEEGVNVEIHSIENELLSSTTFQPNTDTMFVLNGYKIDSADQQQT